MCYNHLACEKDDTSDADLGVAQLVARYLGVVEAAGSSPVTQTKISSNFSAFVLNSSLFCL